MNPNYPAVGELYAQALNLYTGETAVIDGDTRLSYSQLAARVSQLMAAFTAVGLKPGDRVGLGLHMCSDFVELVVSAHIANLTVIELNPELPWDMVEHRVNLAKINAVFIRADQYSAEKISRFATLASQVYGLGSAEVGDDFHTLADTCPVQKIAYSPSPAPGAIYFTSGSTGLPKGFTVKSSAAAAQALLIMATVNHPPVPVCVIGMTHPTVMHLLLTPTIIRGGTVVTAPSADLDVLVSTAKAHRANFLFLPTRMLYTLLDKGDAQWMKDQIELFYYGGENMTVDRLKEAIHACGPTFAQVFGTSESGPAAILRPRDHDLDNPQQLGSLGRPIVGIEMEVRNEKGIVLPANEPGYLYIRSPSAFIEYIGQPEKTRETLVDGWVNPGDVGYRDERGYFYFLDRDKFAVQVNGRNIYPRTVEMSLGLHPAISAVVVMGVEIADDKKLCVAVQLRRGASLSAEDVAALVEKEFLVAPHKTLFLADMPLNPVSKKLDRPVLEDLFRTATT